MSIRDVSDLDSGASTLRGSGFLAASPGAASVYQGSGLNLSDQSLLCRRDNSPFLTPGFFKSQWHIQAKH